MPGAHVRSLLPCAGLREVVWYQEKNKGEKAQLMHMRLILIKMPCNRPWLAALMRHCREVSLGLALAPDLVQGHDRIRSIAADVLQKRHSGLCLEQQALNRNSWQQALTYPA